MHIEAHGLGKSDVSPRQHRENVTTATFTYGSHIAIHKIVSRERHVERRGFTNLNLVCKYCGMKSCSKKGLNAHMKINHQAENESQLKHCNYFPIPKRGKWLVVLERI